MSDTDQMKIISIILFFLSILYQSFQPAFAYKLPEECNSEKPKDCVTCSVQSTKKNSPDLNSLAKPLKTLANYSYLETEVEKLSKVNNALKKSLMPLLRTLRDGESEPTYKASREKIAEINSAFNTLTVLSKESIVLQKKFNICLTACSAYRKLQLSDELVRVQKLKVSLFMSQPILANKKFEERMSKIEDKMLSDESLFSKESFESDLKEALLENLGKLDKRDNEFFLFQQDGKRPYRPEAHENYVKNYISEAASRFPAILEDLVKGAYHEGDFSNPDKREAACYYAEQFKTYSDRKEYTDLAVDTGLFIIPMFAGPVGTLSAELIFGERLALWGLKSLESKNAVTAASAFFQVGVAGVDLDRLKTLSEECKTTEVHFLNQSSEAQLNEFRDCQKRLGAKVFQTELSLIAAGTTSLSTAGLKFLSNTAAKGAATAKTASVVNLESKSLEEVSGYIYKNGLKLEKNQIGLEFKTADSGVFSVMDLNAVSKSENAAVKNIPEDYWRYVGNIYNERLNLTQKEVDGFIKSSVEMSPRTKLILNTEKSPLLGKMKINGGVGIVHAEKAGELLPLEKATGIRINRKPDEKIVEIVRLTVGKDVEAEKISKALVADAVSLITQDKSVSRVFIFTSKIHARLYKRMGIPADKIKDIDKRDVLIEMTRSELERVMKEKPILEKVQTYLPARLKISSMMTYIWSGGSAPSILAPLMR
jgi:hypothetical protein